MRYSSRALMFQVCRRNRVDDVRVIWVWSHDVPRWKRKKWVLLLDEQAIRSQIIEDTRREDESRGQL